VEGKTQVNDSTIWIIVNAEDTEQQATRRNALGCKELCNARIQAEADMLYKGLCEQASRLKSGDRIVMHQGGKRDLGGQLLRAAGWVKSGPRILTMDDVKSYQKLWDATKSWYRDWPTTLAKISGEQIIFYELKESSSPQSSPTSIRPMPEDKFIPIHPKCTIHKRCSSYAQVDIFWRKVTGQPYYLSF
jgi:hypothetical protein